MVFALIFSLAACGTQSSGSDTKQSATNAQSSADTTDSSNSSTGKTVIPFCTSTSDGIGDSGSKLAQMAGTGTWQEGMRFSEREEESAVKEWAQGIGLK